MIKTLKIYTFLFLYFMPQFVLGQKKVVVIPFKLTTFNNISIKAILNKTDTVNLMFHTAASDVTLTENATQKIKSITFNKSTEGIKSWGGSENEARLSEHNILEIGELSFKEISIWENKNSGQETDGKFGLNLFKDKVIQIDFDKLQLKIRETLPKKTKKYEKLNLAFKNEMMFVDANCSVNDTVYINYFLIHSGYSGSILFDDKFVAENAFSTKLKITGTKELKDSYGNIVKTQKAILPNFKIGKINLSNVPVGFFEGAIGRQKMSIIGGDLLKRFNMIIDAKREFIYIKTNKLKKQKFIN